LRGLRVFCYGFFWRSAAITSTLAQSETGFNISLFSREGISMNHKKCSNCGFINFLSAETCRKCETSLDAVGHPETYGQPTPGYSYGYQNQPQPHAARKSGNATLIKVLAGVGALLVLAVIAVGVVSVVLVAKSHSRVAWQEFQPGEQGLSVMMPGPPTAHEPVVTPLSIGEMKNYMYTSTVIGQGSVLFGMVVFPANFDNLKIADKVLDGELDNMLKGSDSTLVSKSGFDEGEIKGLAFEFKPPGNVIPRVDRGFGKMYLTKNRLYFLTIVAKDNSELFAGKEKFLKPTIPLW
jgi:hypothetical protein